MPNLLVVVSYDPRMENLIRTMHNYFRSDLNITLLALALTLILTACSSLPINADAKADSIDGTPVTLEYTPETSPEGSPTPEVSLQPSQNAGADLNPFTEVISNPVFGGIMVLADGQFKSIDPFGQPLGFTADAAGIEWISDLQVGVTKKNVLLATHDGLELIDWEGSRLLPFAGAKSMMSVDISRDGTRIAWVTDEVIGSGLQVELWTANFDGSDAVKVFELTPAETRVKPTALEILGWTVDEKLVFATRADGIGGYILYMGWNDLYVFDPATGVTTDLYIDDGSNGMCVNSISNNLNMVAIGCDTIRILNLATGSWVDFPEVNEQNRAGSTKFSPINTLIAYSVARSDPENEFSQLILAPADGSSPPVVLDTIEGSAFTVLGWIDENTVLYQSSPGFGEAPEIWRIETDGSSGPSRIAEGVFAGFIY